MPNISNRLARSKNTPKPGASRSPGSGFRELMPFMWLPIYGLSTMCAGRTLADREINFNRTGYNLRVRPVDPNLATATIYDADVLMVAISKLTAAGNDRTVVNMARGMDRYPARFDFEPHELLLTIGRKPSGRRVAELKEALRRLHNTNVHLIDAGTKRNRDPWPSFESTLITAYECPDRRSGNRGDKPSWSMTVATWIRDRVLLNPKSVKSIEPWYFSLRKDPLVRVVARLAIVKYNFNPDLGFARIPYSHIRERSGSKMETTKFHNSMKRIVERDNLPDYALAHSDNEHLGPCLLIRPRSPSPPAYTNKPSKPGSPPRGLGSTSNVDSRPTAVADGFEVIGVDPDPDSCGEIFL